MVHFKAIIIFEYNELNRNLHKSQQNGCETPVSRKFSFKSLSSNSFAAINMEGKVSHKMTSPAPRQNQVTPLIWIPELVNVTIGYEVTGNPDICAGKLW